MFIRNTFVKLFQNKISRFDDDISTACASFNMLIQNNKIVKAKIAGGGMSEIPKRAISIEKLVNSIFKSFLKAQNLIRNDFSPIDDMRGSKNYRIEIARNLLIKFFMKLIHKKILGLISNEK